MPEIPQDIHETVTQAARRDVVESESIALLAEQISRQNGWSCSPVAARVRVSQMLGGQAHRHLHADDLPLIIKVTRRIGVIGPLWRAMLEMQAELRGEIKAPESSVVMARVARMRKAS